MPKIVSTAKHATSSVHPRISIGNVQRAVADQPMVACKMSPLIYLSVSAHVEVLRTPSSYTSFPIWDQSGQFVRTVLLCTHNCIFYPVSCQERPLVAKKSSVGPKYVQCELQVPRRSFKVLPDSKKYKINFVSFWHACDFTLQIDQCGLSKVLLCK